VEGPRIRLSTRFIKLAGRSTRNAVPRVFLTPWHAQPSAKRGIKGSKILLLGVAYRRMWTTARIAFAELLELLTERGAVLVTMILTFPRAAQDAPLRFFAQTVVALSPAASASTTVLIATDHTSYDYDAIVRDAKLVVDSRNATRRVKQGAKKSSMLNRAPGKAR